MKEGEEGNLGGGGAVAVARYLEECPSGHNDLIRRESSTLGLVAIVGRSNQNGKRENVGVMLMLGL